MNEDYVELVDYSIPTFACGLLIVIGGLVLGLQGFVPQVVAAVGVTSGVFVFLAGAVLLMLDPLYFRTETRVRIEWQWLSDKLPVQTVED